MKRYLKVAGVLLFILGGSLVSSEEWLPRISLCFPQSNVFGKASYKVLPVPPTPLPVSLENLLANFNRTSFQKFDELLGLLDYCLPLEWTHDFVMAARAAGYENIVAEINTLNDNRNPYIAIVYTTEEVNTLIGTETTARVASDKDLEQRLTTLLTDSLSAMNITLDAPAQETLTTVITKAVLAEVSQQVEVMRSQIISDLLQDEAFLAQLKEKLAQ